MRILMLTDFYAPFVGGVEVLVGALSRELVARGHEVVVATLAADGLAAEETLAGVRVHRLRSTTQRVGRLHATTRTWAPPVPDPGLVAGLRSVLRREQPEVVHGHDWIARSYLPLARSRRRGFAMSLHYYTLSCPKKSLMRFGVPCSGPGLRKCLRCAGAHYGPAKGAATVLGQFAFSQVEAALVDLFLPVSLATAAANGLVGSPHAYEVVPNFVQDAPDASPHRELLELLPAEPFLLFVGDLRRDKGIDVLLDAYARLEPRSPLVLLGKLWPGSPKVLPAGALVLPDWPNAAVREAMRSALALVVPSVWPEPFGIVVCEALAAGCPIVASATGGIPEIVRDGREALLVPAGDSSALAATLGRVAGDPELRARLVEQGAARAAAFTPDRIVPMFEAAYARIVKRASTAAHA